MSAGSSLSGSHLLAASLPDKRSAGSASSWDRPTLWGPLLTPNCPKQSSPGGSQLLLSAFTIPFSCLSSITPAKRSPQKHTLQQGRAGASWSSHSSSTANILSWSPGKRKNIPILMSGLSQQTPGMWLPHFSSCRSNVERGEEGKSWDPKCWLVVLVHVEGAQVPTGLTSESWDIMSVSGSFSSSCNKA